MSIYQNLGITTLINAYGTVTRYGGSIMDPRVLEAMAQASRSYVDMDEFHRAVGRRIADLLCCEAAFVTSGAEAGICVTTAAIMAGTDIVRVLALPDSREMANEVLILKAHRSRYDQGIRVAGAGLVEIGSTDLAHPESVEAAISEKTAFLFYLAESSEDRGSLSLQTLSDICRSRNIPIVVDAAAELPPRRNIQGFFDAGADVVILSGGKDIAGPQSSGLVLGPEAIIKACMANSCPNHSIGRSMKVDKETLAGILRAVELYVERNETQQKSEWETMAELIRRSLEDLPAVRVTKDFPAEPGIQPREILRVFIEPEPGSNLDAQMLQRELRYGEPAIIAGIYRNSVMINPQNIQSAEAGVVTDRIREIFRAAR